jgi:glyoxylase-like metal-dependent hydrolase (beta-lactamase superfamily II)
LVLAGLLAYTFVPAALDPDAYGRDESFQPPDRTRNAQVELTLSLINCGKMLSRQAFVWLGGSWSQTYESGMAAALIRHPKATFLFDAGFGANVDAHIKTIPWLMRALTTYDKETNAAAQLAQHGLATTQINMVVVSHSHWDHVSGIEDFPGVQVLVAKEEEEHIGKLPPSELASQMRDKLNLRSIEFTADPYENFDRSYDLFGDGSIVLVPLPGHTPGSLGMFVNLRSGKRFLFVGDLTWAVEGIQIPAERPWLARKFVDLDEDQVRRSIVKVHRLLKRYPDLVVVPAHDRRLHSNIAQFPQVEN